MNNPNIETTMGREFMDSNIKSNPLVSSSKVVDGRVDRIVAENG